VMTAKPPADIWPRLTIKAGLKYILHKGERPPLLDRRKIAFVGGLQHPYGTRVKPASFSIRLKTLLPLRRGITSAGLSLSVYKSIPVMTLTGNRFHQGLTDPYRGLKND
jgi:hypothetical protein